MTPKRQNNSDTPRQAENRCAVGHPAWCEHTLCTADPAATTLDGYRAGAGGHHRSAPIPLNLTGAIWLPAQSAAAYLTESVAPWPCSSYLTVQIGDTELSLPTDTASLVLAALTALVASARDGAEVTR